MHLQFNEEMLIFIADHAFSGLFGTFFFNTEMQRYTVTILCHHALQLLYACPTTAVLMLYHC
jgi:hypothetical protein